MVLWRKSLQATFLWALTWSPLLADGFPVEEISIEQLHSAYRSGKTTAVEVVRQHLERIAAYDKQGPLLNSLVNVNPRAVEEAAALDAKFRQTGKFIGPLHGVPVIVKDNIDVVGMAMTSGFQGWKNYLPPSDATLAKKIRDAGVKRSRALSLR